MNADGFTFVVCRVPLGVGGSSYEVRQLFGNETYEAVTDSADGSRVTVFRRDGEVVDSAGEFCGEFDDRGEARVQAGRLAKMLEVMES